MTDKSGISLELLAPARDYKHGKTAIDSGADAVYIGAPAFGARAAASASLDDIAGLCRYAHIFGARVHVAMNTLLYDDELSRAERMARQLWEAGADALIIQDMAFAMMNLPPIELHASTQTAALTPERVRFLERAGFSRVILERGLSLEEIKAIRAATSVELECFVHGAVCVCHSGQCYMSHIVSGRSGNRGECSQPCRSTFDLTDEEGRMIERGGHLLSVADMSLADSLGELIDAGITSFKIEGRLKDEAYLKNSVVHLSRRLDEAIASRRGFTRSSSGCVRADFEPDPARTFSRGFTDYYLHDTSNRVATVSTAKSTGRLVGSVATVGDAFFTLKGTQDRLVPGDGLLIVSPDGAIAGTGVNRHEGDRVYVRSSDGIVPGASVFRNFDKTFVDRLNALRPSRTIDTVIKVSFSDGSLTAEAEAGGVCVAVRDEISYPRADNIKRAEEVLVSQMRKSGGSPFAVTDVSVEGVVPFMPVSAVNGLRRRLLDMLLEERIACYRRPAGAPLVPVEAGGGKADYRYNVVNAWSRRFYELCGFTEIEQGVELRDDFVGIEAMRTRYCIRRELGMCLREGGRGGRLYLDNNVNRFLLDFDCARCMMGVTYVGRYREARTGKSGDRGEAYRGGTRRDKPQRAVGGRYDGRTASHRKTKRNG